MKSVSESVENIVEKEENVECHYIFKRFLSIIPFPNIQF